MKNYKAAGIVLHTVKYGENALIAYVLTDRFGRQNYLIRGIRSTKGKGSKAALFQPMFLLEFEGSENPRSQLHGMKEIRLSVPLQTVPFDVRKSTIALFMAETLYRLVRETEPNQPLFEFVRDSVLNLDTLERGTANFHLWFLVRLSAYLGFQPGNEYTDGDWFDICEGCFTPALPSHRMAVSQPNARLLDRLMNTSAQHLASIELPRQQRADFMNSLLTYFGYHLDAVHHIRSLGILREVF